jgi:hypothetical protein
MWLAARRCRRTRIVYGGVRHARPAWSGGTLACRSGAIAEGRQASPTWSQLRTLDTPPRTACDTAPGMAWTIPPCTQDSLLHDTGCMSIPVSAPVAQLWPGPGCDGSRRSACSMNSACSAPVSSWAAERIWWQATTITERAPAPPAGRRGACACLARTRQRLAPCTRAAGAGGDGESGARTGW